MGASFLGVQHDGTRCHSGRSVESINYSSVTTWICHSSSLHFAMTVPSHGFPRDLLLQVPPGTVFPRQVSATVVRQSRSHSAFFTMTVIWPTVNRLHAMFRIGSVNQWLFLNPTTTVQRGKILSLTMPNTDSIDKIKSFFTFMYFYLKFYGIWLFNS